jgi:hypothetical protein
MIPSSLANSKPLLFELAKTKDDFEASFHLLYKLYLKMGYTDSDPSEMRIIIHNLLPSTYLLLAKSENKIIGTITILMDNPFGFPMEKIFNLSSVRKPNQIGVELCGLAIHPLYRRKNGSELFYTLTEMALAYAKEQLGAHYFVSNIDPKYIDFYKSYFSVSRIEYEDGAIKNYLGAPASAIFKNIEPPAKGQSKGLLPPLPMTETTLVYFLSKKPELITSLSRTEIKLLLNQFPQNRIRSMISDLANQDHFSPDLQTKKIS